MHRARNWYTPCLLHDSCCSGRIAQAQEGAHRSALSVVFSKKSGFSAPTTESFILMSTSCSSLKTQLVSIHAECLKHLYGSASASQGCLQTLSPQCSLKPKHLDVC